QSGAQVVCNYDYDPAGRPANVHNRKVQSNQTISQYQLSYDNQQNAITLNETQMLNGSPETETQVFSFGVMNRLIRAQYGDYGVDYTYDNAGRRKNGSGQAGLPPGARGFHGATGENATSVPTWARPVVDLAGYAYVGGYALATAPARLARGTINFVDRFSRMDWEQRILTVTQPVFQTALHFSPQRLVKSWLNQAQSYWAYANDPFSGNWAAWNYITSTGTDGLAYQTGDFIRTNARIAAFAFAGGAPFAGRGGATSIFPEGVPTVIRAVGGADEALSVLSSEADYWRKIARLHGPGDTVPLEQLLETRRIMLKEAKQTYHSMGKRVKVIRPAEGELVKGIPFAFPNPAVPVPLATRAIQFSLRGQFMLKNSAPNGFSRPISMKRFIESGSSLASSPGRTCMKSSWLIWMSFDGRLAVKPPFQSSGPFMPKRLPSMKTYMVGDLDPSLSMTW
ncbi:MAG TPA: hypothetical protein PLB18_19770, partial [Acidobacteriota bacterium]|nr:hypothetical protein [Acidobacteriota bacterium]